MYFIHVIDTGAGYYSHDAKLTRTLEKQLDDAIVKD